MKIRLLIVMILTASCYSQKPFLEIDLKEMQSDWNIKDAYLIEDKNTKECYTIFEEDKVTYGLKFDTNKSMVGNLKSDGVKRKYKEIVGHIVKDDKILLIQMNNKGNKFAYIQYDFKTGKTTEAEYDIKDRSDRFVESYVTSDRCIIYTTNVSSRVLKKWEYYINGTYKVKTINTASQFELNGLDDNNLDSFLVEPDVLSLTIDMVKVNNKIPNNIVITSNPNKMYEFDNSFIWTLDGELEYTILLYFNYPNFEPKMRLIPKTQLNQKLGGKSNSYLFEDKIAQIMSNNKELIIDIKRLNSPEIPIKTLRVEKKEDIPFKNSPILQEGSTYSFGNTREMEKTSKLLRKMSSEDNGISVYRKNDRYHVTIGGKREQVTGGAPMMLPGFGGMPVGQFGAMTVSFNPTFYAYGMYSNTDSTRIECLFDENFNHVEGEIDENIFDRINDFKDLNDDIISVESVTYLEGKIIFGYLDKTKEKYIFKVFE